LHEELLAKETLTYDLKEADW